MSETAKGTVHAEGDLDTVLFVLPSRCREFREGDIVTYISPSGKVKYKVETVDYRVISINHPNPETGGQLWKESQVFYGVSVVP